MLRNELGLILEQVSGANEKGGTSTTGEQGRRLFSEESINGVIKCIPEKFHNDVKELHFYLSVILSVVSRKCKVHVDMFTKFCEDASMLIANKFPWVNINFTLHGLLHHSAELIQCNSGWALGELSEEALESNNKLIRNYIETHSRKTSPTDQITDVMNRLLERSNPIIVHNKQLRNPKLKCLTCGSDEHTASGHKKVKSGLCKRYNVTIESLCNID